MRFPAASVLLAVLAATQEVDATLSPFRYSTSSKVSRGNGWFAGTDLRGGSMGKRNIIESMKCSLSVVGISCSFWYRSLLQL
jgi:hypothetical protein